jgi:hypothetical protein
MVMHFEWGANFPAYTSSLDIIRPVMGETLS